MSPTSDPNRPREEAPMSSTPAPAHPLPFDYLGARPTAEQVVDRDAAELRAND